MKNFKKIFFTAVFIAVFFVFLGIKNPTVKALTVQELQAQINALLSQINQLRDKLAQMQGTETSTWCHNFYSNLRFGNRGTEVSALHTALKKQGYIISNEDEVQGYFGQSTVSAISEFQERYASEVLTPWGLRVGTGSVATTTKNKLNNLYGCGVSKVLNYIRIISPNGGETWQAEKNYEIAWIPNYLTINDKVSIFLTFSDGAVKSTIASNVSALAGKYNWIIPTTISVGSQYKIKVQVSTSVDTSMGSIDDLSDDTFSIIAPETTPIPPTPWTPPTPGCADECPVVWQTQCVGSTSKQTCGYYYDTDSCLEWSSVQSCQGSTMCDYATCTATQRPVWYCTRGSCLYRCEEDTTCKPTNATTTTPYIKVTYPNGGENLVINQNYKIMWSNSAIGIYLRVNILLVAYDQLGNQVGVPKYIASATDNIGYYSWTINNDFLSGFPSTAVKYKIRITQANQNIEKDESNNYFNIIQPAITCTDSDGGINYNIKGKTSGILRATGQASFSDDSCIDKDFLEEFYCDGNIISLIHNKCTYGCENGVCKQAQSYTCSGCFDVNRDGWVVPQDVLLISNLIYYTPLLSDRCVSGSKYDSKMDINKDNCITADDVNCITNDIKINGSRQITCDNSGASKDIENQLASISDVISKILEQLRDLGY